MFGFGVQELILILAIILLLFGGKKLPELSKNLGTAVKDLRRGFTEDPSESKKDANTEA
jgi:sec-independent protein translocase protein TatA